MKKNDSLLKMCLTLFIICIVMAFLLSFVNSMTFERIAQNSEKTLKESLVLVHPEADLFEPYDDATLQGSASMVYLATSGGQKAGYCVLANPVGYGGEISLIVGFNLNKQITGVKILSISETPGLGSNAQDPEFLEQFINKSNSFVVVTTASGKENEIVSLSSATITSNAVTKGINDALKTIEKEAP